MRFEVFIPAEDEAGLDITMNLEAPGWMQALKGGLAKLGGGLGEVRHVVCNVQDDGSIHVSEPSSGRVFRVRELREPAFHTADTLDDDASLARTDPDLGPITDLRARPESRRAIEPNKTDPDLSAEETAWRLAAEEASKLAEQKRMRERAEAEVRRRYEEEEARRRQAEDERRRSEQRRQDDREAARRKAEQARRLFEEEVRQARATIDTEPLEVKVLSESSSRHDFEAATIIRRAIAAEEDDDDRLARIFEAMAALDREAPDRRGAAELALRLASEHVEVESGSVLLSELGSTELRFEAAIGPKAREVKRFKILMGQGIAGFVAREGLTVSVRDARKDPRFLPDIGERIDYETRSVLCAPLLHQGRSMGCIELINRQGRKDFGPGDIAVLSYVGTRLAEYLARI